MPVLLTAPADSVIRFCVDDLAEFYYTIRVARTRSQRNAIATPFAASDLAHFKAFDATKHWGQCHLALASLAMGDSLAVELAQQSHVGVLRYLAGALVPSQTVSHRRAFPRGDFAEFLCIDDHISAQVVNRRAAQLAPARDTDVFSQATAAYDAVHLVQHPKKKRRGLLEGTFLGAEIDGDAGLVSAPRDRLLTLMLCTGEVARRGWATPKLLSMLLGCWIHALMFRRPAMCVLDASFAEAAKHPATHLRRLPRQVRNELLAVSVLGPLLQTDLRVSWCPELFCMDASPTGSGLCSAPSTEAAVRELWRLSEQRGFYTKLEAPSSAALRELGFESSVPYESNEDCSGSLFPLHNSLAEGILFDCIELSYCQTGWSEAHLALGLMVHPFAADVASQGTFELCSPAVFGVLQSLAARGVVRDWHFCPPAASFASRGVRRVRSASCPAGFPQLGARAVADNKLARAVAFLCCLVASSGCFFSVHQPRQSLLFHLHCFRQVLRQGAGFLRWCACASGAPFKGAATWLHNKAWLLDLGSACRCVTPHFKLEGTLGSNS